KTFGQISAYLPLGRLGGLAGSLRLGRIDPRAGLGRDPILEPADPEAAPHPASGVPMAERFFAGGRTSHRAFPRDGLGVPGQTLLEIERPDGRAGLVAVGGDALAIANLDYRFPIAGA